MSVGYPGKGLKVSMGIVQGIMKWLQDQKVSMGNNGPMVSASFSGGDISSVRFRGAKMRQRMQTPWVDGPKRR